EYVFGKDPNQEREPEKLEKRFALFRARVKQCLDATNDLGVRSVYTLLEDIANSRQQVALPAECASNDLFAFIYGPDRDMLVTDREKVRAYWKSERAQIGNDSTGEQRCLVSGRSCSQVGLFPPLMKVPGKNTSKGIALVSFNKNAFESFGWEGNANAPISRDAAESCSTALNRLLHPAYPKQSGETWPRRNLQLSADTVVCFWSPKSDSDFCSAFAGLLDASPDEVKELYRSLWRGKLADIDDPSAFYALTLSGTQGRAIVRDWFESTVANVAKNLGEHFKDLKIVRNTPAPKEHGLPPHFPMRLLLRSLAPQGDSKNIPPLLV